VTNDHPEEKKHSDSRKQLQSKLTFI